MGLAPRKVRQLHEFQHGLDLVADLLAWTVILLETEGDVFQHGHVREQRIGLEHHVDRPPVGRNVSHVDIVDINAPCIGRIKARQHAQ